MSGKEHIDAIDGLRGIAILMVVYQHTLATGVGNALVSQCGFRYPYIIGNGWMGVGLFFMLSGFVLALPYFSGTREMKTTGDLLGYYQNRGLRLIPLFVFMALVSYLWNAVQGHDYFESLVLVLSTGSMFTAYEFFPKINGAFWSLMVEIWFSLLFPFLLVALQRYRIALVVAGCMVVAITWRVVGAYYPFSNNHINPVKDFVIARADDFVIGMLIAFWYALRKPVAHNGGSMFVGGWLIILITACFWDLRKQREIPEYAVALFNNLSQLGFGLILVSVLRRGWPGVLLRMWWLRVLGAMCFSIYCWHLLLITPALRFNPFDLGEQLLYWCTLILLSCLTYRFIEFTRQRSLSKLFLLEPACPMHDVGRGDAT